MCPCWVGEDPDGGSCDAVNAYRFERGTIRGVDVSGLSFINVVHIPGNVLAPGSWQVVSFVDDRASDAQFQAIRAGTRPPTCCATTGAAPGPPSAWAGATACTAWAAAGR